MTKQKDISRCYITKQGNQEPLSKLIWCHYSPRFQRIIANWIANDARSSYPTSASGIIVLIKTPTKYREFLQTLFLKTTDFQLVFNFEQTRTVTITIFGQHGIMAYGVFSHDVSAAILVSQNNETAAMLVSQTSPLGVELFSYANAFFCSNKFA